MADAPNGGQGAPTLQAAPFAINLQYIRDLSFENPNAPQSFNAGGDPPQISVDVNVSAKPVGTNLFETALAIRAEAKRGDNVMFIVELSYAGICAVAAEVPAEHVRPLILIEGPRFLFPFARSIIADAVRDGGFPPLFITPIDFAQLYRLQAQRAAEQAGTVTGAKSDS